MKRLMDILLSGTGLLLLSPVFLLLWLAVLVSLGRPVLFVQQRPGRQGKPFLMLKFRTMLDKYDDQGNLLSDEKRLTRFGRFLRSTSLDELPELLNVLKGDMSLVGPRPLLMEYLPLYTPEQYRRHEVLPGITGWAQVNGRNGLSWKQKFKLDVWYVDNQSVWLDIQILCKTVGQVLRRKGVNAADHATMHKFQGSEARDVKH